MAIQAARQGARIRGVTCRICGISAVFGKRTFPGWTDAQRQELARNQFIQGVLSPTIQLRLMREMPASLEAALEEAGKLESIERLQRVKTSTGALPVAAAIGESETPQANAVRRDSETSLDPRVDEFTKELK